ncbi:MAG: cache domain-containing protein [bacterium]|nr:cache domain-containing protein [bacterium]
MSYLTPRQYRTLIISVLVALATLLGLGFFELYSGYFSRWQFEAVEEQLQEMLQEDAQAVSRHARDLASSEVVKRYIAGGAVTELLGYTAEESKRLGINFITVTDKEGFVLSRTTLPTFRGDYLPGTTPATASALTGTPFTSLVAGISSPLYIISGVPVIADGVQIGAVFAGHPLDSAYAARAIQTGFGSGIELAFWSRTEGITGSSFADADTAGLLSAYLVPLGNDEVLRSIDRQRVNLNGHMYYAQVLPLKRGTEELGSAIFFLPISLYTSAILLLTLLALFALLLEALIHLYISSARKEWREHLALLFFVLIVLGATALSVALLKSRVLNLKQPPFTIYNATMDFLPAYGIFTRQAEQKMAVRVTTGGERINSARVQVLYDPKVVQVEDILIGNSFCPQELFAEKSIDNKKGEVRISCGVPTPGISGGTSILAELLLQPLQEKEFTLQFGPETGVYADDGLGSNVLRVAQGSSYRIAKQFKIFVDGLPEIAVFSPTHPNSARWYRERRMLFTWPHYGDFEYSFVLEREGSTEPVASGITTADFAEVEVADDGHYAFSVSARKGGKEGPVTRVRAQMDMVPPEVPVITASADDVERGEVVRFLFSGADKESGLQGGFYVKFFKGESDEESIFLPVSPPMFLPFLEKGEFKVRVRVFDKAGNYSENDKVITVH